MAAPNRSPMRVLIRPPSSSSITPPSTTTIPPPFAAIHQRPPSALPPLPPPPSTPFRQNGVVVVGFIGRRKGDVSQLINRIIDANVFGSGDADVALGFEKTGEIVTDEVKDWFKQRQISYYHEETKGVLYLQFCSTKCPVMVGFSEIPSGFDSVFEKQDFGDLQGMLFMFSVCHVVIFIQEGSHFDIQILKKFRVLQGAKHAMFPFKSQTLQSRSHTSSSSHTSPSRTQTKNHSPNKNGPPMARNSSSVTLMSGLGSYNHTSLFPGQCTPVILFVFLDDINETGSSTSNPDESTQFSSLVRPKGSGPVVVLSRPVTTKPEGGCGFKKKLQSSLEAQIRFSIKKCRVLSGSETGPPGSRNGSGPISNHMPLFSLDGSKAVLLLDKPSNNSGESLEFATSIVENVLEGISTSDSLLLETHSQSSYKEDIVSLKEFIYRQCDILRGRGGASVSGGGGGMVAVAAAAAAASVASGKPPPLTPDLPSLDVWLTSSQTILHGLLSAKLLVLPESEQTKRRSRNRNNVSLPVSPAIEGGQPKVNDPLELAATYLDNSKGLNSKFSISWCQRALPIAKDVYLHDLPPCYPTSQHESHLSKALTFFKSMVKGPAVEVYLKKLETECISIWVSGRQLCDAVSLTGKSCTHQRHDENSLPHCSGFVFLHACACGRSRKLRLDPFDFEAANVTFSCYPECDKLLPTLILPEGNSNNTEGPIMSKSWSLTRIGGSRYYQPSKGLLQSGFSNTDKFLQKWKFFLEKHKEVNQDSRVEDVSVKKTGVDVNSKSKNLDDSKSNNSTNSVPNFTMKKPFSEVVAGSSSSTSSGFPPLQLKKKSLLLNLENVNKEKNDDQESKKVLNLSSVHEDGNGNANGNNSFLQRGNFGNLLNINGRENNSLNQVVVYIGFEHECPCGHRFILTPDHLKGLGSIYAMDESVENRGAELSKIGKHGGQNSKIHRHANRMANPGVSKVRNPVKSRETASNGNQGQNGHKDIEGSLQSMILDDDGNGVFPLLNRNLPLYLNCPHCQIHKNKNDPPNGQFAGTISQLQRIFLVTPPFPVVMSTCPVIQFEVSCVPPSVVVENEKKVEFSLGCPVILPPESFLSLRLPFVYGVKAEDGSFYPLRPFESQPELTAWLTKGTALQVLSKGGSDVM